MSAQPEPESLAMTPARREMLEHVVRHRIYTWAGEPLRIGVEEGHARFDRAHRQAFVDLQHARLVTGEYITGLGYAVAQAWGLNPDENLKGRVRP